MTLRRVEIARGAWGLVLLLAPTAVLNRVHHVQLDRRAVMVARVLGARHLSQAVLSGVHPSPEVLAVGAWVDAAHSATAVAFAVADPARARAALSDAVVAGSWSALGYRDVTAARPTPPGHDRWRDRLALLALRVVPGGDDLAQRARAARAS